MEEILKIVGPTAAVAIVAISTLSKIQSRLLNHMQHSLDRNTEAIQNLTKVIEKIK